jgi:hypothetical protein
MEIQVFNENDENACWHGAIPPMWWAPNQFQHLQHVEFNVNFTFFWKSNEVT